MYIISIIRYASIYTQHRHLRTMPNAIPTESMYYMFAYLGFSLRLATDFRGFSCVTNGLPSREPISARIHP